MDSKYYAEIGLISSYLLLLSALIFWELEPFHFLLSFLIEYTAVLLVYLYVSAHLSKGIIESIVTTLSHLFNGLGLGLLQGCFVMLMAYMIEGELNFYEHVANLPWGILAIAGPVLIFQFHALRGKSINKNIQDEKMGELVFSAVTFPVIILAGMLTYEVSNENPTLAMTGIVLAKIAVEVWKNHFRKKDEKKIPT